MMSTGRMGDRMWNGLRDLRRYGDGISPRQDGHAVILETALDEGHHRKKQKIFGTKRNQ